MLNIILTYSINVFFAILLLFSAMLLIYHNLSV